MQVNRILKSVFVTIFLFNICSLGSSQEDLGLLEEVLQDTGDLKALVNSTESDDKNNTENGELGINELTVTPTPTATSIVISTTDIGSSGTDPSSPEATITTENPNSTTVAENTSTILLSSTDVPTSTDGSSKLTDETETTGGTTKESTADTSEDTTPISSSQSTSSSSTNPTTTTTQATASNPEKAKVRPWAIAVIAILISFAILFTLLYFLRGYLIKKRRMDQRRLLGSRVSQEGFFFGESGDGFREL